MLDVDKVTLAISFGTTHETACERSITATEIALTLAMPDSMVVRAFTSTKVRSALAKKDIHVDSVPEALDAAVAMGCKELTVAPTFVLAGEEYERAMTLIKARADEFETIRFAAPLLSSHEDYHAVIDAIAQMYPVDVDTALVLVGHGTDRPIGMAYAALNYEAHISGHHNMFVGCVEGYPGPEAVAARIKAAGLTKAFIVPLMLVAGDHVWHDVFGDKDTSWRSVLEREGLEPQGVTRGLGEYEPIRQLYCAHMLAAK